MKRVYKTALVLMLAIFSPMATLAQGTQIAFGGLHHDSTLPVEITSDQLIVGQSDGSAVFTGNVVIGQGKMRLSAAQVRVEYATGAQSTGKISRLVATGGVTLVSGTEAAESSEAVYSIESGNIVMTGHVILTQGLNALSADRMVVNLHTGTGTLDGRVKTILQTSGN